MTQATNVHSPSLEMSLDELCQSAHLPTDYLVELVQYNIVLPIAGAEPREWLFSIAAVTRVNKAARLHRDLDMDWADVALVLDLLEDIDRLRTENDQLKQQLNRLLTVIQ
ncbi:chaperone modulator CbpM [Allohahella marinimesophila]|uniref:Chaperone modulatory protein CbpM n=1 Tax=Allohahella marinimesophila TaxID=1054972 RepID=A0ABP7P8X0_9GAMM